jgi:hypothetical protein
MLPLAAAPALRGADANVPADDEAWRQMASLRFAEARAAFPRSSDASEPEQLGRALSLLGAQPKTAANVAEAERILAGLAASARDSDLAARAAYFHARVPHVHRQPTDWAEASRRYLAAHAAHPAHPLGQRAYVRHGVVTLFRPAAADEFAETLRHFLEGAAALDQTDALRDLDWLLTAVHERRLRDPAATLHHLERLLAGPAPLREITRLGFLVQAGELARELGEPARAARHYREFLAATRRDARVHFVRERLAEMEASS